MPSYQNSGTSDDMLSDSPDSKTQETPSSETEKGDRTALVPTSFCPGMKPGDEFTVKVEEVQNGQYVLSYPEGGAESPAEEKGEPRSSERSNEMDEMLQ